MKQTTFASAAYDHKKVTTKPKKILAVNGQISSMATVVRVNRTALSQERYVGLNGKVFYWKRLNLLIM